MNPPNTARKDGLIDFVTDADHAILQQTPLRGRAILWLLVLSVGLFVWWASWATVDELVKGDARVVPSSRLQVLQSLDGGIVESILVKEGDQVEVDQPLVRIDQTRFQSSVRENDAQRTALAARAERINAFLDKRIFAIPKSLKGDDAAVYAQELRYYENAKQNLAASLSIAREQLAQRQQERVEAMSRRNQAASQLASSQEELKMTRPLLKSGAVSEVEILRLEREVSRHTGERDQAAAQVTRLDAAIAEARSKVQQVEIEVRSEMRRELSDTMAKLNALSEGNVGLEDKVTRSVVRSPMRGFVKRLLVNTVGGVVTPGKDIVEVVPADDLLVLEARVLPSDIAFLRIGQDATVKFSSYDFTIYGGMPAKILEIGADSTIDEKGNAFFIVKLQTMQTKLNGELPIIPGMQAQIDIKTGQKTVLTYLIKPILRAHQNALTER